MDFAGALRFILKGHRAQREAWAARKAYVFYLDPSKQTERWTDPYTGAPLVMAPFIAMRVGASGTCYTWSASSADQMAEDWKILE